MVKIECNQFGILSVYENGKEVNIPPGKVSGLFYYILNKKVVSRDELAVMFWPITNEEKAKISLRNAVHKIRKSFQADIITSPNKYTISLNPDFEYAIDTEAFATSPIENMEKYKGEFLKGLCLKDLAEFEYWLAENREYFQKIYVSTLQSKIVDSFKDEKTDQTVNDIVNLLSMDSYNETAYIYLFKYYKLNGRNDKIINEYHNLKKMFAEDLGIDPPDEIVAFYEEAMKKISKNKEESSKEETELFYSRTFELQLLQNNLDNFYNNQDSRSIIITGEDGVGKTVLKRELLKNNKDKFKIFEVNCYNIERNFSYSPWVKLINLLDGEFIKNSDKKPNIWDDTARRLFFYGSNDFKVSNILESKENYNPDQIYNAIYEALEAIGKNKKILVVIEDVQWADTPSLKLLINLILHVGKQIRIIATKTNNIGENIDSQLATLVELDKVMMLNLKRFNKTDVGIIVTRMVNNKEVTEEDINNIYIKSKGNTFFLKEYIELFKNNKENEFMTSRMYDVINSKFSYLNEDEMTMLKIISAFHGDVNINILLKIVPVAAFDVIKYLNSFVKKDILQEIQTDNQTFVTFAHSVYKEFIYGELSDAIKKVINRQIAEVLEEELINDNKDITNYVTLKYHYEQAGESVKSLKYEVYTLNYYLNFNHEVFPNLDDYDLSKQVKLNINNEKAIAWMEEIEREILKVKNINRRSSQLDEINETELMFLFSKGRYLIRCGKYSTGVSVINRVIQLAKELSDQKTEILGHKQMVIYGIQINDCEIMLRHIVSGLKVAKSIEDHIEIGVLYRLYGVYHMMKGRLSEAERFFEKSISIFTNKESLNNNNSISIAANYNYIGEIRNSEANYLKAMECFNKAVELCKETNVTCLALFYINSGKTSYLMGNMKEMQRYLQYSKDIVKEFDSYWKNPVLDALLSLYYFNNHEYEQCLGYLKSAVTEVKTINNPRDIGMVYFVQTIILNVLINDNLDCSALREFYEEPLEIYYYKALKYLDKYRDKSEIDLLKEKLSKTK